MRRDSSLARLGAFGVALAALSSTILLVVIAPANVRFADLHVYREAVRTWLGGGSLYTYHAANGDPFNYPPFAGLFLIPVGLLPSLAVDVASLVLNVLALLVIAHNLNVPKPGPAYRSAYRSASVAWVVAALAISAPVRSNLLFGQVSLTLAALTLAGLVARPARLGSLLGVAAAVKLLPLSTISLGLVGRVRVAHLRWALGIFGALTLLMAAIDLNDTTTYFTHLVASTTGVPHFDIADNQSLLAVLSRLHIQGPAARSVWFLAAVLLTSLLAIRIRAEHNTSPVALCVVTGALAIVLSPISWTHHQIWLALIPWCATSLPTVQRWLWISASALFVWVTPSLPHLCSPVWGWAINEGRFLLALSAVLLLPLRRDRQTSSPGVSPP